MPVRTCSRQSDCGIRLQATPKVDLSKEKAKALMERIQNAGTEVVEAKVRLQSILHTLAELSINN